MKAIKSPGFALPSSLLCLLLALSGCASQQPAAQQTPQPAAQATEDAAARQIASLNAGQQAAQNLIGELGRKMEALAGEMRGLKDSVAAQDARLRRDEASRAAQVRKIEETRQQLNDLMVTTSYAASQAALARDADQAALEDRLEAAENLVEELQSQAEEAATQTAQRQSASDAALAAAQQRSEQLAARVDALAALKQDVTRLSALTAHDQSTQELARQAEMSDLDARLEDLEEQLSELLEQGEEHAPLLASVTTLKGQVEAADGGLQEIRKRLEEDLDDLFTRMENGEETLETLETRAGQTDAHLLEQREKGDLSAARLAALEQRLEEIARQAQDALDATGLGQRKIYGKVVDSVVLTEDKTLFPLNSPDLGEADRAKLDALAEKVKALGTAYHLQINGHTDGIGSDDYNFELGKARAEVVKHYLNNQKGVPLLRMSVISHGALEAAKAAPNSNRRIVIQLLR